MDLNVIEKEIRKLERAETCYDICERLAWLYIIRDHQRGEQKNDNHAAPLPLTRADAEAWVASMRNTDTAKPTGGRWTWDQTSAVMAERGLRYPPADWYAVLNMLYSDYGPLLAKHGPKELDAYVEMARAFLDDPDAAPNKMSRYYRYITK